MVMARVHKLSNIPSVSEYVSGLTAIKSRMSRLQLQLLQEQYFSPNRTTTATNLALATGVSHRSVVNAAYGRLGRLFCEEIGLEPNKRKNETSRWWSVWSVGHSTSAGFLWEMHQEVAEALENLGWVISNNVLGEFSEETYAKIFEELHYDHDGRHPPDRRKRAQFKIGWQNATLRQISYTKKTLDNELSWNNLGYRFGLRLGNQAESKIYEVYEFLAKRYSDSLLKASSDQVSGIFPDEVDSALTFREGAMRKITVNAYERDPKARQKCIDYYGLSCSICSFNFGETFGTLGEGFIHVHHLQPISDIAEEYEVDPIQDLRPVCPNCHAMLHRHSPPLSIEKMREILLISK